MKYIVEIDKTAGNGEYEYKEAKSLFEAQVDGFIAYHEKPGTVYLVSLYPKRKGTTSRTHIYRGKKWVSGKKLRETENELTLTI
jgi:hypothetical protein